MNTRTKPAVLVEMNLSVWTAQRVDRKASDKVTTDAHATADAGQFKKNLMAGTNLRKDIADYAALCRTWHSGRTLPWSDKGVRLLPMSMFMDYKQEANARRSYFEDRVARFLDQYPMLVTTAHNHLGSLFDASEYPSIEEIRQKFAFRLVFSPIPEAGDFRFQMEADERKELEQQWQQAADQRLNDAMRTAWTKLHDMLANMSEKLIEPEDEGKKIFHTTFVSNAVELCELLTHLNITGDKDLEAARKMLEATISNVDIGDLREDAHLRADIKAKVDEAISKFSAW